MVIVLLHLSRLIIQCFKIKIAEDNINLRNLSSFRSEELLFLLFKNNKGHTIVSTKHTVILGKYKTSAMWADDQ